MKYKLTKENKSNENDYIDQNGLSWNSPEEWVWSGILGGCGCGSSEEFGKKSVKLLKHFAT